MMCREEARASALTIRVEAPNAPLGAYSARRRGGTVQRTVQLGASRSTFNELVRASPISEAICSYRRARAIDGAIVRRHRTPPSTARPPRFEKERAPRMLDMRTVDAAQLDAQSADEYTPSPVRHWTRDPSPQPRTSRSALADGIVGQPSHYATTEDGRFSSATHRNGGSSTAPSRDCGTAVARTRRSAQLTRSPAATDAASRRSDILHRRRSS